MEAYYVQEALDRKIPISRHIEAGLGASGKYCSSFNIGHTGDRSDGKRAIHGAGKMGLGTAVGGVASILIDQD